MSLIVWLVLCGALATPPAPEPRRVALLVGVGYDPASGWSDLEGPPHDVTAMAAALGRWGFRDDEVRQLVGAEATREAIVAGIRDHLGSAGPDDVVVFYYSGHGQQVTDDDGDEPDGLDEALVPADNRGTADAGGHLRDDTLEALFADLSSEHVIVLVDACHSGSVTRGEATARRGPR
ncbi:MAG: caspase family protein, partial [Myxococcota bacterium]